MRKKHASNPMCAMRKTILMQRWRKPGARNKEKWIMTSLRDKVTNPRTQRSFHLWLLSSCKAHREKRPAEWNLDQVTFRPNGKMQATECVRIKFGTICTWFTSILVLG